MKDKTTGCTCKELSCPRDCTRNHTHKGFFCEVCSPVETPKENWKELAGYAIDFPPKCEVVALSDVENLLLTQRQEIGGKIFKILNNTDWVTRDCKDIQKELFTIYLSLSDLSERIEEHYKNK